MKYEQFNLAFSGSRYFQFLEEHQIPRECREVGQELHHRYLRKFEDGEINSPENLTLLSVQDHVIAHLLLAQEIERIPDDRDRTVAILAVNWICGIQWSTLSEDQQKAVFDTVPEITELRTKGLEMAHRLAQSEEAREKLKQTNLARYGSVRGRLGEPEIRKKASDNSRATKCKMYGNPMGKAGLPETLEKSKQTRLQRYGDTMHACHSPEVQKVASVNSRKAKLVLYGTGIGKAGLPEFREKAKVTKRRKQTVVRSPEFLEWWKEHKQWYRQRNLAVYDFLKYAQKTLLDYEEFKEF